MSKKKHPGFNKSEPIFIGREVLRIESSAIRALIPNISSAFQKTVELILKSSARVIVTGMGKPGIIGQKISATLSSTGTASLFLHPAEAVHGDLGRVKEDDIILALSNSGETDEIKKLLPLIKKIGAKLISFTGNVKSTLAVHSDIVLNVGVKKEACPLGLAPTASTTAMLAMGDALSIALLKARGFQAENFAFYHPGGSLGKKLWLKVEDVMRKDNAYTVAPEGMSLRRVLYAITKARAGSATVVDKDGRLVGIFTDGDLRRNLEKDPYIMERQIRDIMTRAPAVIKKGSMAVEALGMLRKRHIDEIPVVDKNYKPIGLVDVQDLLKAGLV
jgi:arabinose-5-phosphate isomerase